MDIDIDIAPSKRPEIFREIRKEVGEINFLQVATFGTEGTKSAILTACRGYRSEMFPEGIDSDVGQFLSALIPSHRGFLWPIEDVLYGNEEEDRRPVREFIEAVNEFPGLIDIIINIGGLINKRSSHAAGVVFYNNSPFDTTAIMKTPGGDIVTQYSLHDAEYAGDIKYDFLVTEISDKMIACIDFLKEAGYMEKDLSLRELYNKYLHPAALDLSRKEIWDRLAKGDVLDVFQFNTSVGLMAAKTIKPSNIGEMTAANALMRLMAEKGKESPLDRYVRMKSTKGSWQEEAARYGLSKKEIASMSKYYERHFGTPPFQEDLMTVLMDKETCGFTLGESNLARKLVAKKQMEKIPEFKQKIWNRASSPNMAKYLWDTLIAPQLGYGFSELHSLAYSFVGVQSLVLATRFPEIYWCTACIAVNSGSADEEAEGKATEYDKIAKAIGEVIKHGINVSLVDINRSGFGFRPDEEGNQILYGLKGVNSVGDELVRDIVRCRPYSSMKDFITRIAPNKSAMVNLIKSGAFDELEGKARLEVMADYLTITSEPKKRVTLQNLAMIIEKDLLPPQFADQKKIFNFTRYCKGLLNKSTDCYLLDDIAYNFIRNNGYEDYLEGGLQEGRPALHKNTWKKNVYDVQLLPVKEWMKDNQTEVLTLLNKALFDAEWEKYASGNISSWEMDSVCFYKHRHELEDINYKKYGVSRFADLISEEEDGFFMIRGKKIPRRKLSLIVGTCIGKDKSKSTIYLLTTDGVVNVKFRAEYFAMFNKQISGLDENGTKKVLEKSWFSRGSKLMITGYRREDDFVPKKYAATQTHQLYKIEEVKDNGDILLRSQRVGSCVEVA